MHKDLSSIHRTAKKNVFKHKRQDSSKGSTEQVYAQKVKDKYMSDSSFIHLEVWDHVGPS
jgi:hypothetical protein